MRFVTLYRRQGSRSLGKLQKLVMDRKAWHAAIHGVAKSRRWLSDWTDKDNINHMWLLSHIASTSLPPPASKPLGHCRAPSWIPCAIQLPPANYLFYSRWCKYISACYTILHSNNNELESQVFHILTIIFFFFLIHRISLIDCRADGKHCTGLALNNNIFWF